MGPQHISGRIEISPFTEAGRAFMNKPIHPGRELGTAPQQSLSFRSEEALPLDCGRLLVPFEIAYQTYGTLNADRSNAVVVCHALTGDQHVASHHPVTGKPGWWETVVGPGKPVDTDRYFVICANVLGGCMGSTGRRRSIRTPASPTASTFPSSPSTTWCARKRG